MMAVIIIGIIWGIAATAFLSSAIKNLLRENLLKGALFLLINMSFIIIPLVLIAVLAIENLVWVAVSLVASELVTSVVVFFFKTTRNN